MGKDEDQDGIPDSWEENGVCEDENGNLRACRSGETRDIDLPAMGANKNHKDIFVEIDYMVKAGQDGHTHKPKDEALQKVIDAFKDAPDGGIDIHIDVDEELDHAPTLGEFSPDTDGDGIPDEYNWSDFNQIKKQHFSPVRENVFHYCIFAHF